MHQEEEFDMITLKAEKETECKAKKLDVRVTSQEFLVEKK